jgi:hypothetical protein
MPLLNTPLSGIWGEKYRISRRRLRAGGWEKIPTGSGVRCGGNEGDGVNATEKRNPN